MSKDKKPCTMARQPSHIILYLLPIEALVEDHTNRPNVHFVGDLGRLFSNHKAFWGKIPEPQKQMLSSELSNFSLSKKIQPIHLPVCSRTL